MPTPAPVVVTKSKVSLADHLELRNLPLATTPGGRNFVIKSLHPADSEIKTIRGPGGVLPTVSVSSDLVATIPFPAGAVQCSIVQSSNPAIPCSIVFADNLGHMIDWYLWENGCLGSTGSGLNNAPNINSFMQNFYADLRNASQQYRVVAQSVTGELVAPALADQGTITSAQLDAVPQTQSPAYASFAADGSINKINNLVDVWYYESPPPADVLLMGTSAFTGKAKDGFYQPLKIGKFKWHSTRDPMIQMVLPNSTTIAGNNANPTYGDFPIYTNSQAFLKNEVPWPKPTSHTVGLTWMQGVSISQSVAVRFRMRQVIEMVPRIGGRYAPMAEAPYPPDELAYKMITEIGARMKDAYPASYNDLGKLVNEIMRVGKDLIKYADPALDALSVVPGIGNVVSAAKTGVKLAKGIGGVVDAVSGAKSARPAASPKPRKQKKKRQTTSVEKLPGGMTVRRTKRS